jgi:hypothetical protein
VKPTLPHGFIDGWDGPHSIDWYEMFELMHPGIRDRQAVRDKELADRKQFAEDTKTFERRENGTYSSTR